MNRTLTTEQARAAHTLDRHVSVTAGPGAGKTAVLVERYLEILRTVREISVDQIVAITFTNRAANEMRTRLRADLDRLMRSAEGRERSRWLRHKRLLDGAVITTIHGFCSRLLRQFPIEARVDPQFELMDEHQTAMLEEAVAEEVLTELINSGDEKIARLTVAVTRPRLAAAMIEMYRSARNEGTSLDDLARHTAVSHSQVEILGEKLLELNVRMQQFLGLRLSTPAAEQKRRSTARRWPVLRVLLEHAATDTQADEGLARLCEEVRSFREECRPSRLDPIVEIVDSLDELIWAKDLVGLVPGLIFDIEARKYSSELFRALGRLEARLTDEKTRLGVLDFDDLQTKTIEMLSGHPEVLRRAAAAYRFYLVDEFQDTNGLQRDLLERLALSSPARANLFIVGDRRQSIYGFRGADVDVFREMTSRIEDQQGLSAVLDVNFRSQEPLIGFFNFLFERVFSPEYQVDANELSELGYVGHEPGIAVRSGEEEGPLVELLVDFRSDQAVGRSGGASERDAQQLARRIGALIGRFRYKDIALLFRAMTDVQTYEAELRRVGIPFLTVQGKGFYAREEVTDLIQLLRFIDNRTDEIALAAVLRSPLCGLSDNALYALRCAPTVAGARERGRMTRRRGVRPLLYALKHHRRVGFIDEVEREAVERSRVFLDQLLSLRNRTPLADLLRVAVERSEYQPVIAANFDGAARLANVEKLFVLAERFERTGANLIRDFVKFVADFERSGGRESEGQIDESADAVRLMTIHQSKGLEFPVVIIPELHRAADVEREWYLLDRHRGLTVKVPDGRGGMVKGSVFVDFRRRKKLREQFETMRLLYVAATRARDRLILSGAAKDPKSIKHDSWLGRITSAIEIDDAVGKGVQSWTRTVSVDAGVELELSINLANAPEAVYASVEGDAGADADSTPLPESDSQYAGAKSRDTVELPGETSDWFPLLRTVEAERGSAIHRFSVTQLVNHQRCPRQYYFDRILHTPKGEELSWWNSAESPEPPSNLTATLRGAVIHHFCDKYREGEAVRDSLARSFDEVLRYRQAELGDRVSEIDRERAIADLMPLAENYLSSAVRGRIEAAQRWPFQALANRSGAENSKVSRSMAAACSGESGYAPHASATLPIIVSEQRFRLRRPLGILTGTIDKLIIQPAAGGDGRAVEIVDFKTNRFRKRGAAASGRTALNSRSRPRRSAESRHGGKVDQLAFAFSEPAADDDLLTRAEVETAALDYRLQMQAYALAARELLPLATRVKATLHFLDPNVEVSLPDDLLDRDVCAEAIDRAAGTILSSTDPKDFPVRPANHCRTCSFLSLCAAGRGWIKN